MPTIHVMSPTLASQVAAGEVVERPASVVKELVENSLDAGAKSVRVEIRRGGVGLIRVTDDGCGMSREDASLCAKRHATSKLSSLEELFEITHLGFRGEAIPSIASVSRFKLCTRQQHALEGWEVRIDGGMEHEPRSSGVSPGTAIEVADLFYNTPARRKFLKSAETEASHVEHQIRLHALAFPQVRFTYRRDDQLVFDLPATTDLRVRISALTDPATAAALIPIEATTGPGISVSGYLLPLSEARRTRKGQYVFMNTRPVEDQLINRAIRDGYGGFPTGLHPALFLYMEVEPALVDVNVHPAKTVVKFAAEKAVFDAVHYTVKDALDGEGRPKAAEKPFYQTMTAQGQAWAVPAMAVRDVAPEPDKPFTAPAAPGVVYHITPPEVRTPAEETAERPETTPSPAPAAEPEQQEIAMPEGPAAAEQPWRVAGEVLKTYIICEDAERNVWLIDKHAAHERMRFDALKARTEPPMRQLLLTPAAVTLAAEEYTAVLEDLELLADCGFLCEDFGDGTVLVREVPDDVRAEDAAATLEELAQKLRLHSADRAALRDEVLHTVACKSAIKAGMTSDPAELRALAAQVQSGAVRYCPHGRPVAVKLREYEIEKMFKRA